MTDPDDLLDEDINVSFDLDNEDVHVNNSRNFSYPKKTERYSSFRLDDDDDAEEEPQYEHRAPSPSPIHDMLPIEEDVPDIPQLFSNSELAAPVRTREDSDDEDDKRERSRFKSERKINLSSKGSFSNNNTIPDSLDKVTVRTTSTSGNSKSWKSKQRQTRQQPPRPFGGRGSFGNETQPLFSQSNTILQSMMRGWDQNGYGPYQGHVGQMAGRSMVMNAHSDWFTPYNSDPYQSTPYQSWTSGHGYQTHYSQPVQQYPQMNLSSPSYGFNRNSRGMPYVHPYVQQSTPPTNVRNRLGPAKREASSIGGPPAKAPKTTAPEKHRNLRPVDTVTKPSEKKEEKEEKKEEEPGVPGETDPPPPPPKEVDIKELFPETNDAEMSEYMKKIEEQKKKRAELVREKEMKRMREAQIKLEQHMTTQQPSAEEAEKVETNGLDTKTAEVTTAEVPSKTEEPTSTEQPAKTETPAVTESEVKTDVPTNPDIPAKTEAVPAKVEPKPKVEVPAKVDSKPEEKKSGDSDVPGTKLVRVKTREGKIVVRRVPLETLSKMKKLSPEQASEAKEMLDPKKTVVLVENLSATTTKDQLFNMGKQVGTVLEAEVDGETKSGRIAFDNAQLAKAFMSKFQRKMVDLSMITLVLATADELWPPLPTQLDDE